jgi:hypothetical protein
MGNILLRKRQVQSYAGTGSRPEDACENLEQILISKFKSAIVTIGPENLTPMVASPRANAVHRVCLANINGKQYNVKITKEGMINGTVLYTAIVRV